jgi:peptide deformylase
VVLPITKYGHPVLREKGRRIELIDDTVRQLASDMIETMYAANGVGLAAQQIGQALLLTVIDVSQSEIPSDLIINGQTKLLDDFMPMILINPQITHADGEITGSEGCLSIPEVNADIRRSARITVHAQDIAGKPLAFQCTGLLARAVQHELDHLNGVLFIDRMDAATRASFSGKLKKLQKATLDSLKKAGPRRRFLTLR